MTLDDLAEICAQHGISHISIDASRAHWSVSAFQRDPVGKYHQARGATLPEAAANCVNKFTFDLTTATESAQSRSTTDLTGLL